MNETQDVDLSGHWFGRLRVMRPVAPHFRTGCRRWRVLCYCGLATEIDEAGLLDGSITDCGCAVVQVKHRRVKVA
jgi:hypothetical protein